MIAFGLRDILSRAFYALQDTKTPMINGAISVAFNILLNLILIKFMAHSGLALATSISTTILTILLLYSLKKKIGSIGLKSYINCGIKSFISSVIMGLVAYLVYYGLFGVLGDSKLYNLISLIIAVGVGAIVYGILCYILGVEEVRMLVNKIKGKMIKN